MTNAIAGSRSRPMLTQIRRVLRETEDNQRLEIDFNENWTPQALQQVCTNICSRRKMFIVSNREPYIHNTTPKSACAGARQRHGHGARTDRARLRGHLGCAWQRHRRATSWTAMTVQCPRTTQLYVTARVAVAEEEEGFYYGFSNEGLWPLCHLAYVRPAFREADWKQYRSRQPQVRRHLVAQEAKSQVPGDSGAGLSLRVCCRDCCATHTQGHDRAFLAYPVAQRGNIRSVPVEAARFC